MAYLGHKPAVGENNSFRILDDISSFVLTFDGSSASAVGLSDETITITENNHRFITGQRVTYSNGGGGNITGLTNGQAYFVINHSSTQIKLASSASNALAGTAVNLTGLGTGSSHTLTLAFDGVNTKFVPTFGDGMHDTLIKRAAQLVISLNGVIQQPHDTATPSTGFGVDSLGNLIFSTAPASTDIFWAHVLATNTVTFDSSDNDVDTFTGNGSTTSFTLSKIPPDNRNILVTIDGVVQYPSDAANTRSYNLSENVMTFVAAPGLGTVIQVRHIGYAGPAAGGGGGVTGFYGRTGNVSLIATDNILANDATFSGNVSIAQTLTYEDVTDIDSVGLITARSGIKDSTLTAGHVVFAGTAGRLSGEANLFYNSSNDRLGIGSATPEGNLIIHGGADNPGLKLKRNTGGGDIASITWGSNSANFARINYRDASPHGLQFYSGGTASSNLSMIIRLDGNVGIGSDLPSQKLDVIGNIKASGTITGSSFVGALPISNDGNDRVITATGTTGTLNAESNFTYNGTSCTIKGTTDGVLNLDTTDSRGSFIRFQQGGTTKVWVGSGQGLSLGDLDDLGLMATDNIIMRAGSDEKVRITSGGNMGVGNADPTQARLVVENSSGNTIAAVKSGNAGAIALGGPSQPRILMEAGQSSSDLLIYTAQGSSWGTPTWQEKFRITSAGLVGINETSPDDTLHITKASANHGIKLERTSSLTGSVSIQVQSNGALKLESDNNISYISGSSQQHIFYRGSSTEIARFDTSGRLLLGSDSNIQVDSSNPRVQVTGTSDSTAHLSVSNFSASTTGAILSLVKSRGTVGNYNAVQDDDIIGKINFIGADGTDLAEVSGKIVVSCDAAVAGNRVPSRMEFYNTDGNGTLDLNMVLTRDSQLFLPQGITRDAMAALAHNTADDFVFGRTSGAADTGMTIVTPSATSGFINFADADGQRQGSILYQHGSGQDRMYFRTNNNQTAMVIDSSQNIGVGIDPPQTKLNVRGTISTGRNVARELGTVINVSSEHHSSRAGSNVINGKKNYEYHMDWLAAGNARTNANLTIDLGSAKTCDRFVIYNQNEYSDSKREVKNFTLEGSNDNSSWTTLLDDDCGCSHAHEPNPGFSFRLPEGNIYGVDDDEGVSYRYWRFTMKTFHGSDSYGGIMELELYEVGDTSVSASKVGSEITTHSLVAGDISTQRMNGIQMLTSSEGLNIHTGEAASDTWEITETGIVTSGSFADKSTIRHKRGVMAMSSGYNTGDLYIRIDNIYNLPGNAWWTFGLWIMSNQTVGTLSGHYSAMVHVAMTGLGSWSSGSFNDIQGSMASSCSVDSHGTNFVEIKLDANDSSRGPVTVLCNGGTFDPPRISFH